MKKLALVIAFAVVLAISATSAVADQITLSGDLAGGGLFTTTAFDFSGTSGACGPNCVSGHAYLEPAGIPATYWIWNTGGTLTLTGSPSDYSVTTPPGTVWLEVKLGAASDLKAWVNFTDLYALSLYPEFVGSATVTTSTGMFSSIFPVGGTGGFNVTFDVASKLPTTEGGTVSAGELRPPVPEPSSLALLGSGIVGLAGLIRRKTR